MSITSPFTDLEVTLDGRWVETEHTNTAVVVRCPFDVNGPRMHEPLFHHDAFSGVSEPPRPETELSPQLPRRGTVRRSVVDLAPVEREVGCEDSDMRFKRSTTEMGDELGSGRRRAAADELGGGGEPAPKLGILRGLRWAISCWRCVRPL